MEKISELLKVDLSDPINLIPLILIATIVIYAIAIFADQPPE
ncbi:hypothetical protein [Nitratifractor salsuginis]|uniref:Uncharacterized protein n=1 Tax=Nitratifractor salsuginis (strain DSM 16511 / JCM 12458 / E9I37-1) TaxID=749222 RepID=E6WYI6_NITSE|nr:hypothetical protein [Nitratifractor salsuginis]ADV46498.1 hypothetical protein Nitsa_1245 [Nitratifractor salsuginis DSM 16511]